MKTVLTYILFIVIALGGGLVIGFTNMPGEWYQSLVKPPFNPPNWIFAPVWSLLYVLIGIAGGRTWLMVGPGSTAMKLWFAQMILNFLWSPLFFGSQMPSVALVVIILLLVAILAFIARQRTAEPISALCFAPYALWVAFATLLNASIVILN